MYMIFSLRQILSPVKKFQSVWQMSGITSEDFAKTDTWYNGSVWHKNLPYKIYLDQCPKFHGPLILPYRYIF